MEKAALAVQKCANPVKSQKMLQKNACFQKIGFDADENEPSEVFAAAKPIQYREKEPFYRTPAFL